MHGGGSADKTNLLKHANTSDNVRVLFLPFSLNFSKWNGHTSNFNYCIIVMHLMHGNTIEPHTAWFTHVLWSTHLKVVARNSNAAHVRTYEWIRYSFQH